MLALPPRELVETFDRLIPGFSRDPKRIAIAQIMWATVEPNRQHRQHPGAYSFKTAEIRSLFGEVRGFKDANRLGQRYFSVGPWQNGRQRKDDNFTNGYRPQPWMQRALDDYLAFGDSATPVDLKARTAIGRGNAISSLDWAGNPIKRWKGIAIQRTVPVNQANLSKLAGFLEHLDDHLKLGHSLPKDFWCAESQVKHVLRQAQRLCLEARGGAIGLRYFMAQSGRLYASGLNLQNCKREIRFAALGGHSDYDLKACHFAILAQLATRYGHPSNRIFEYVENRREIRIQIARNTGLTVPEVKQALAAVAYGAKLSKRARDAIPSALGFDRAVRLYGDQTFRALVDDLRAAVQVVVKSHPLKQGRFVNAAGRLIDVREATSQSAAHLLQGIEAVALESAVRTCASNVLLLQHDGFTADRRLDVERLNRAVFDATGLILEFEEDQIRTPSIDLTNLSTLNRPKPTPYRGFEDFLASFSGTTASALACLPPPHPEPWHITPSF